MIGAVVRSGVARRRVQTVVVGLVVLVAVASSVLGGSLLVASSRPFDRAFGQQRGAHLIAQFDAAKVTSSQLAAPVAGVVAQAGPFPSAAVNPVDGQGRALPPFTLVGRSGPGGAVDAVSLVEGRWASAPGELVISSDGRVRGGRSRAVGARWTVPDLPGSPVLTVVGSARSISGTADGWVVPEQLAGAGSWQMLYRFAAADTDAQVRVGRAAVVTALPAGAVTASRSWLVTRQDQAGNTALFVPFLIAFGIMGLVMAVLIVGNVVAGAVGAGTRRIGILKAVGFTPGQVVRAYLAQAVIPASAGAGLGVVAGNLLMVPVLSETNHIYGTNDSGVTWWVDVAVVAGIVGLVVVTAWVAALRAGRLRTVDALAVGRARSAGRGRSVAWLVGRLPVSRPVTLGLAHPFGRPGRSLAVVAAVGFGAAAVTFAVGLAGSLTQVQASSGHGDVRVTPALLHQKGARSGLDVAAVDAVLRGRAGTAGYCAVGSTEVTVAGLTGAQEVRAGAGGRCGYGYRMVSGSWYGGPGEVVVGTLFLTATHTSVGDSVVLTDHGHRVVVRIVGEVFNTENGGLQILTAAGTLPWVTADGYDVIVAGGNDVAGYAAALDAALAPAGARAEVAEDRTADVVLIIDALAALLTVMLIVVAALGVLNTVVLETRERVHDLGVHKALGMAPGQTVTMVIASVVVTGIAGGLLGTPLGVLVQRVVVTRMAWSAGLRLPASVLDVYGVPELFLFGLGGLVIAVLGALLPAGWAARTRTAVALRTE
ncbi:ABC transporter permease [Actinoplanes sp. NPDC020271]|uniref:ABC transporter permease n=1 Tax=Actinoplanes sp. NPDC020271 TaxID=3363896 RepID=UPI0037A96B56